MSRSYRKAYCLTHGSDRYLKKVTHKRFRLKSRNSLQCEKEILPENFKESALNCYALRGKDKFFYGHNPPYLRNFSEEQIRTWRRK